MEKLEKILEDNCNGYMWHWLNEAEYRKQFILDAMKEACKQVIHEIIMESICSKDDSDGETTYTISETAILNILNSVE